MLKKFLFILFSIPTVLLAQHKIAGQFSPAEEYEWVLLYKNTAESTEYITRAAIDSLGKFEINLNPDHTKGMYKLVYNLPQDTYNFDIIYNGKEDVEFSFSKAGLEYLNSSENKLMASYSKSMGMINQSIGNFYRQQSTDSSALIAIFKTLKDTQSEYEKLAEGKMASHFIKANKPFLPEEFMPVNAYISNIKTSYFDNVNFNDELLISSNFLVERVLNYVFGMSGNGASETEVYKNNIVEVSKYLVSATQQTKKMIYAVLWQQLSSANYEEVANFISENYLIDLAVSLGETTLVDELAKYKKLSTGQPAPNFDIENVVEGNVVKSDLNSLDTSQYYILVFWSSTCSHCLEELPQLQGFIKNIKEEDVKVIAFGLEDEESSWKNEISNYPEFLNVLGLGKWENKIGIDYNVTSTPAYYVLDKDKKILAKPLNFKELITVFQ